MHPARCQTLACAVYVEREDIISVCVILCDVTKMNINIWFQHLMTSIVIHILSLRVLKYFCLVTSIKMIVHFHYFVTSYHMTVSFLCIWTFPNQFILENLKTNFQKDCITYILPNLMFSQQVSMTLISLLSLGIPYVLCQVIFKATNPPPSTHTHTHMQTHTHTDKQASVYSGWQGTRLCWKKNLPAFHSDRDHWAADPTPRLIGMGISWKYVT